MVDWYCSSVAYTAVAQYANATAYTVGQIIRQLATPTVGNERCFRCTTAGTSGGSEPTWTLTKGSTTTAGGAVFTEVTGNSAFQQVGSTSTWTAPHARVENMIAWMATGDRGFASSDHTQTVASGATLTSPGVATQFFSVNRTTGNVPPAAGDLTNGAAVAISTANNLTVTGSGFWQGFTFTAGSSAVSANLVIENAANTSYFRNCTFALGGSGASSQIQLAMNTSSRVVLDSPIFQFGAAGNSVVVGGYTSIFGGSLAGVMPTTLFATTCSGLLELRGFDTSALTGGSSVFSGATNNSQSPCSITYIDGKLSSSAAVVSSGVRQPSELYVDLINCDSGATNYRSERHRYQGDLTTETTITRTGGATIGGQGVSHKVVTNANASINTPFECLLLVVPNGVTGGAKTATVQLVSSGTLNNNDVWAVLEYLGSAGTPVASFANDTIATRLTTAAAQTASTAAWNSLPATPVTQQLQISFTAQQVGLVQVQIYVAKPSTTLYIDPEITIS